jgi:hypothetical protein
MSLRSCGPRTGVYLWPIVACSEPSGLRAVAIANAASEKKRIMPSKVNEDDRPTEDDLVREKLGPRGIPGQPDPPRMTPQQKKNMPEVGEFDGHTA